MPRKPTTFEDLRTDIPLSHRVALTVAAVLPNLPDDESLIVVRSNEYGRFETDRDVVESFKHGHRPVVDGSDVYRVRTDHDAAKRDKAEVTPVPHPRRSYRISGHDFVEMVPVDVDEYDFADTDQSTLTDFGSPSPYFSPYYKLGGEYARKPTLPV